MKLPTAFQAFIRDVLEPRVLPVYRNSDPVRRWHGALHVSRCLIFSEAMLGCYRSIRVPTTRFDPMAIRLALVWMDAGRAEGVDKWQEASANLSAEFLTSVGVTAEYADYVGTLITGRQSDPNATLVQACDTLDTLRLQPLWSFPMDRLSFLHPTADPVVPGDGSAAYRRNQLIPEAKKWIQHTESKQAVLAASPTCCQDMLQDLTDAKDQFPTLCSWLEGAV